MSSKSSARRQPARRGGRGGEPASGAVPLSAAEKTLGLSVPTARDRYGRLTAREIQVAGLMADAKPNRLIAEELGISPKTLDIHRANVMHKLEAETTAGVANLVNLLRLADAAPSDG